MIHDPCVYYFLGLNAVLIGKGVPACYGAGIAQSL
jgi:hypothetical protein